MHQFTVGEVTVHVLEDGTWQFPARAFFRNADEAAWREHVGADRDGKIPVGHNCALVDTGRELILIDTGYGADTHGGSTGRLLEDLARSGYRPEDVTRVINTHAHGDHIKGNTVMQGGRRMPAFPRARYHIGRADWDWFHGAAGRVHEFDEHVGALDALGVLALTEGELALAPEVSLRPTPGHTPGHTSVVIESQGRTAVFLGDLCHHPLHFSHPDWVSEFDTHPERTPRTRAEVFAFAVARDALLICPHALPPGVGRLRRADHGFVWQAAA